MPDMGASLNTGLRRLALGWLLALALHLTWMGPGLAQAPAWAETVDTHPVFLDGSYLFDVPGSPDLKAEERAAAIETNLAPLVGASELPQVRLETRPMTAADGTELPSIPIIFADDRYVMTVTQADAKAGKADTPEAQGKVWVETINDALTQAQIERQGSFWVQSLLKALAALVLAFGLSWLASKVWHGWLKPFVAQFSFWPDDMDGHVTGLNLLFRLSLLVVRGGIWFSALAYIANLFPFTRWLRYLVFDSLGDGLFARSFTLGDRGYSLFNLLLLLGTLLGSVIAASMATNVLRSRFLRITGISLAAQEAIAVLAKYTLILLGTVVILQIWGIDLSSIALIASGLGIGIGLGLQNLVKDFVSGLVMVFERPVQVGDFVDFGEVKGTVARIGSRSTEIRTLDHVSIIVPNSRFLESEVINWSHGNPVSRIRLPVGVSYSSDPQAVKSALLAACQNNQDILATPAPQVFFSGFGDSALDFQLLVWIAQPERQMVIKSNLFFAVEASLRQHQIEIPFPQRDLHIRSGSLPVDLLAQGSGAFEAQGSGASRAPDP